MYNCKNQIQRVLDQIDDEIMEYVNEIIVIDNGSNDGSRETVLEYIKDRSLKKAKLLLNRENYNLGGSHKVAFNYAIKNEFDYIVVLHGDDQGNIRDLLPYLKNKEYQEYDCFLGARFMEKIKNYGIFKI